MTSEFNHIVKTLNQIYDHQEAVKLAEMIFTDLLGYKKTDIYLISDFQLSDQQKNTLIQATERLLNHEPIQYITGHCQFFDLSFLVNPQILIPRPETEELVDLIIKENKFINPVILDACTGSGCIAITLKKHIPESTVHAFDFKSEIISLAFQNALMNQSQVNFFIFDLKSSENLPFEPESFHMVVANPPYVLESEKTVMSERVLDFEPNSALFVPDDDPLIFYRLIISKTLSLLKPEGKYYFEINEKCGHAIWQFLAGLGMREIKIYKDLNNKNRIVSCVKA